MADDVEAVCVRVDLCSGESIDLTFNDVGVTADQVCDEVSRTLALQIDSRSYFSLWIVGNDLGTRQAGSECGISESERDGRGKRGLGVG